MATRLRLSSSSYRHSTGECVATTADSREDKKRSSGNGSHDPDDRDKQNPCQCTTAAPFMHRTWFSLRNRKRILHWCLRLFLLCLVVLYGVVPVVIYVFPGILNGLIFLTFGNDPIHRPLIVNYSNPEASGLPWTRNLYIDVDEGVRLGTWHVLPSSLASDSTKDDTGDAADAYEPALRKGLPIVLYMHGNSGSRAAYHRVDLYRILRDLDAHVVAFDYRGYGDSSPVSVSEEALVRDGKAVYRWLRKRCGNSPVFIWGHSLGTGVSTHAVSELCQEGEPPKGLILEAPFNNMSEEIVSHPLSWLFRLVPWFRWAAVDALHSKNILFESDKHISGVTVPVVLLHAEDDNIIPIDLGRKLYAAAVDGRPKTMASSMLVFEAKHGYGHRYICKDPNLPVYIRRFLEHPETRLN